MTRSIRPSALRVGAVALAVLLGAATPAAAQPDPETIVNAFEAVLGPIRTHRPSHPKGLCAAGHFTATPDGTRLSVAPVFSGQRNTALIRFGVAGANPNASDSARGTRGLSIRFESPSGDLFEMANISAPVFGAMHPQAFVDGLLSRANDPATGRPSPERAAAYATYLAANPSVGNQGRYIAANAPPVSFATTPYWGVNTFLFRGQDGQVRPARWVFEPRAGVMRLTAEQMQSMGANFLADELRRRVAAGPVEFDMVLQFPGQGDDLLNPTIAWPDDRPRTVVGRLTVTAVEAGPGGPCDPISFMILDQAPGIEMSDDPILQVRAAAYAVSLSRRTP